MPSIRRPKVRGLLTKNTTPFLSVTTTTSRRPPRPELTLIVRGRFTLAPGSEPTVIEGLEQGFATGEVLRDEDDRDSESLYPGDFADFKPRGEVMLRASCHAPGGAAVTDCRAGFSIGRLSKSLRVVGRRVAPDAAPEPFTVMPLRWSEAFGGPGHPHNPVGKGIEGEALPTVEHPAHPLRERGDVVPPAGFGPINAEWPARAGKRGQRYGDDYRRERSPFYAEDFDWTYFQAAPADQWLDGYFKGDERMRFQALHPEAADFSVRLPGLGIRAFLKDVRARFREVPMVLDTVFADLEEGHLTLTWRGLTEIDEDDGRDAAYALIASEPLAGPHESEAYYRAQLEAFEEDPIGLREQAPELEQLMALAERGEPDGPPPTTPEGWVTSRFGTLAEDASPGTGENLRQAFARHTEQMDALRKTDPARADEIAAKLAEGFMPREPVPMPMPLAPGAAGTAPIRPMMRQVQAAAARLREGMATAEKGGAGARELAGQRAAAEKLDAIAQDPKWTQLDPSYEPGGQVSTEEPAPYANLAERDLRGQDLSGRDLSGANLRDAILMEANLRGAKLRGADLTRAVLYKADLSGADLSETNLTQAHVGKAVAREASFRDANLSQTLLEDADLRGADLSGAHGDYTSFEAADLSGSKLTGVKLTSPTFDAAKLDRLDARGAHIERGLFAECAGESVDVSGAELPRCAFQDAVLPGARFAGSRLDRSYWAYAHLDGADFSRAVLTDAHFTEVSAKKSSFVGANLFGGRLNRADLSSSDLSRANLYRADLCKSNLSGATLHDACLFEAKMLKTIDQSADFLGANLTGVLRQPP